MRPKLEGAKGIGTSPPQDSNMAMVEANATDSTAVTEIMVVVLGNPMMVRLMGLPITHHMYIRDSVLHTRKRTGRLATKQNKTKQMQPHPRRLVLGTVMVKTLTRRQHSRRATVVTTEMLGGVRGFLESAETITL